MTKEMINAGFTKGNTESGKACFALPAAYHSVVFRVFCRARQIYLFVNNSNGSTKFLHQMNEMQDGEWRLTLRMKADKYRCRCYAMQDFTPASEEPDELNPVHTDFADVELTVPVTSQSEAISNVVCPRVYLIDTFPAHSASAELG